MNIPTDLVATIFRRLGFLGTMATGGFSTEDDPSDDGQNNARTGKFAIGMVVAMFLFGFASIPLYRMVCAKLDPGGSTASTGDADVYEDVEVQEDRTIEVHFNTNVNSQLPWSFNTDTTTVEVNPGEKKVLDFDVANHATEEMTGKAVYDINPPEAAAHFKKTQCFCFIEQNLDAGEETEFPLVFWLEPDLPEHVEEIHLGYTFFNAESSRARAASDNP